MVYSHFVFIENTQIDKIIRVQYSYLQGILKNFKTIFCVAFLFFFKESNSFSFYLKMDIFFKQK